VAAVSVEVREEVPAPPRWLFAAAGVLWLVVALVILSLDATSAATIGYMVGFVVIMAGVDEFGAALAAPGWRWLHAVAGALFIVAGVMALLEPFQTFGILALFVGWYLLIKGFFDVMTAVAFRHDLPMWGLTLAVGIIQLLLGFWALGYPGRSAWLLLVWVGTGALLRGVGNLVAAFAYGGHR
jgi:uncharacterized membrane protein HdeD (DUF308 family)